MVEREKERKNRLAMETIRLYIEDSAATYENSVLFLTVRDSFIRLDYEKIIFRFVQTALFIAMVSLAGRRRIRYYFVDHLRFFSIYFIHMYLQMYICIRHVVVG